MCSVGAQALEKYDTYPSHLRLHNCTRSNILQGGQIGSWESRWALATFYVSVLTHMFVKLLKPELSDSLNSSESKLARTDRYLFLLIALISSCNCLRSSSTTIFSSGASASESTLISSNSSSSSLSSSSCSMYSLCCSRGFSATTSDA